MTISSRLIGLMICGTLLTGLAVAEDLPLPEWDSPVGPSELTLPSLNGAAPADPSRSMLVGPDGVPIESLEGYDEFAAGPHHMLDHELAPIESSGTWLRRGFWYAEVDAVVWTRIWNRDDKWFASEDPNVNSPTFFLQQFVITNTNRNMLLDGGQPGEDSSVRATLGQFLFRDLQNRDHTAEFTVHGGGNWHQRRVISSDFGLFVPFILDGGNRSFDGSRRQTLDYSSHFRSFELNYRVKWRMGSDQLVMDPNGLWHRAAASGLTYEYLIGLRMMEMRDILTWQAQDIIQLGSDGSYHIRTDNDLFGFQLGGGGAYETSRWSVGTLGRAGVYVNDATSRSTLTFTADDNDDFDRFLREDELSAVLEARVQAKWHLTPNFSLRAAYELMYLTSVALAPNQVNFIPEFGKLSTTQDPFYHGASFGLEGYW